MPFIGNKPTAVPLSSADLEDDIITSAKITDGTIALADLSATGTKDATTFLRGDNTFASAGGTMTPAFEATLTQMSNPGDSVYFKGNYNTEVYDTNGNYDAVTNKRFTPTVAGKYFIYLSANFDAQGVTNFGSCRILIYKNGSSYREAYFDEYSNYYSYAKTPYLGTVVDMNGTTDYVEGYLFFNIITGTAYRVTYGVFGGYKIIE
jgi:hypothetical protein